MKNDEIIEYIKTKYSDIKGIRATVMRDNEIYLVCVMGNIEGKGLICARKTFLEIKFITRFSAYKLKDLINSEFKANLK